MKRGLALLLAALLMLLAPAAFAQTDTNETIRTDDADAPEEMAEFTGIIGKKMKVYKWADDDSLRLGTVEAGTVVDVFNKGRVWTRIAYGDGQGYVNTKFVEMVQRKNPFDGPMPGTSRHVAVACVLKDTSFKPEGYRYAVEVNAGSWLSIETIEDGRAYFPYKREEENVSISTKNLKIYNFVPWDKAQPGDLLYAFTTFYTTSMKKEGNAGRLYNIQLAALRLGATLL